jgi:hypothetical protein
MTSQQTRPGLEIWQGYLRIKEDMWT